MCVCEHVWFPTIVHVCPHDNPGRLVWLQSQSMGEGGAQRPEYMVGVYTAGTEGV